MDPIPSAIQPVARASAIAPARGHQRMRGGDRLFSVSDDSAMLKQIQATHYPDSRVIDVRPLMSIIQDVLRHSTPSAQGVLHGTSAEKAEALEELLYDDYDGILESLAYIIHKISCELSCKCSGAGDPHGSTMAILNLVSSYPWEAKVVISLAAFAIIYGEFWLVTHLYTTNPLAKSLMILKQLPDVVEYSNQLKSRFNAIDILINAMVGVTNCIVDFNDLPPKYISTTEPPLSLALAHIPTAVYWTIRSMVTCASQIISLLGMSDEHITATTEAWELSSLAHKISSIHDHLKTLLSQCHNHIDEEIHKEYFLMLVRLFEMTTHVENLKVLRPLLQPKDDQLALSIREGQSILRVGIEVLRKKTVLLIISDLDISIEEVSVLTTIYEDSKLGRELQVEMVWVPIVDKSIVHDEAQQYKFHDLQSRMPWYTLHHPSQLDPAAIIYIKEVWNFSKKLIVVALDPQGKVVNHNALHMLWIWGMLAFPFTAAKEETLWKGETWKLDLLVDAIDPDLVQWMAQERYICVYGGEDIEWIRKFTATAKEVAIAAGITLQMIYVGKNNARERVMKNNAIISKERISHYVGDPILIWYFWARLESMLLSRMQLLHKTESDDIMREITTMLSFDGNEKGWAIISRGSAEMAKAKADAFLLCMENYPSWEPNVPVLGFVPSIETYLRQTQSPHHCNRLILPGISSGIPERVVCAECGRPMERYFMYRCCND